MDREEEIEKIVRSKAGRYPAPDRKNTVGGIKQTDIIYARVSKVEQRENGALDRQVQYMMEQVKPLSNPVIMREVGTGLDDSRGMIQELLKSVVSGEVAHVYVISKDRLTRFGYNYIKTVCETCGTEIVEIPYKEQERMLADELREDTEILKHVMMFHTT